MLLGALSLWLLAWGFVGMSIVVATTSGAPAGGLDAVIQAVGEFYLTTVRTLRQFGVSTTVSPRWVDVGYAALAGIPIFIHLFITWVGVTLHNDDGPSSSVTGLLIFVPLVAPLGAAVFYLGAQLLTMGILSIGVALVPLAYGGIFAA